MWAGRGRGASGIRIDRGRPGGCPITTRREILQRGFSKNRVIIFLKGKRVLYKVLYKYLKVLYSAARVD